MRLPRPATPYNPPAGAAPTARASVKPELTADVVDENEFFTAATQLIEQGGAGYTFGQLQSLNFEAAKFHLFSRPARNQSYLVLGRNDFDVFMREF